MSAFFAIFRLRDVLAQKDKEKFLGDYLDKSGELMEQLRQLVRNRLWSAGRANLPVDD